MWIFSGISLDDCNQTKSNYLLVFASFLILLAVPNLSMVETLSSLKVANLLDYAWSKKSEKPLDVLIQVNTSGEERKYFVCNRFV